MAKKKKATGERKGKAPGDKKRKGRRARGSGSIFWSESRQVWVARRVIGRTASGKERRLEASAPTQREAVEKLAAIQPPGPETTVSAWGTRWLAGLDVRPATTHNYTVSITHHVIPGLGGIKLADLTSGRIEEFGTKLVKDGMAPATARGVLSHLRNCLAAAVRSGVIAANPAVGTRKPRGSSKRLDPYTPAELSQIIGHADRYTAGAVIALLAGTGCRVGEALALDVADFNRSAETISISKTFDHSHGLGEPKSPHSVRTIRVPDSLVPLLVGAVGDRTKGPLFATSSGARRTLSAIRETWERTCRDLGLDFRKPHQLRHSVATALVRVRESNGWSIPPR